MFIKGIKFKETSAWTEIEPDKAKELWKTNAIYAYDENLEVDWQLNAKENTCISEIDNAVKNGCILFVES